jgi:hypothetical protein
MLCQTDISEFLPEITKWKARSSGSITRKVTASSGAVALADFPIQRHAMLRNMLRENNALASPFRNQLVKPFLPLN